ncbi:hypothetical protein HJC23_008983 [Cyclotella cryptica]|uniref:Uncharacterized protein n=1 Tax=Cyclotella cryptica TaxID=29204 RepID=A0ABD3QRG1_9STRA
MFAVRLITTIYTIRTHLNRYTCTIPGNPFLLNTAEFCYQVLVPSGVGGPCGLLPRALGSTECTIDEINKWQQLQFKIASAAQYSIYHNLCEHLAPGFSATAFTTCKKITMAFQDEDGNSISLTILEYYNALLQGAVTFLEDESFQYNLANHFVNHLERNVCNMFEESCTLHLSFSDLSRDAQLRQLQKYLLIATSCEKKLSQTKDFVRKTIGDTHSFMSKVMSAMGIGIPEDASDGPTFLSAAEKTLQQYKDGRQHGHRELLPPTDKCWGCKGPHRYHDKHTKEIICPNKDAHGVAEHAARMHKEYLKAIRSCRKGWVPKEKVKFSQLLTTLPLPTPKLPHITLVLCTMDTALENCPMIRCLFDTGACLSSGYAGFWLPILKAHPECIADLFTSDNGNYTPIILGGVVYETTTHQPIIHTIAIGLHVGVNTILGKTFIKSLHCHYDATSGVVEAKLLNVAPFPMTDMFTQRYDCTDKVSPSSCRLAKNYSSIVSILDHIKKTMLTLHQLPEPNHCKRKWGVFCPKGMSIPVLDYECNIDTGTAPPVRSKAVNFGLSRDPTFLAPKPHQENVFDIDDYIWRLCVNYIGLNRVTKIITYPIPRCDFAVVILFGHSMSRWLLDAPLRFHQIAVIKSSQEKLASARPYTRKYTYNVMHFGPVNGPATFIIFAHDCQADWDELAKSRGIDVGGSTGTKIIVNDIHSRGVDWDMSLYYFEYQLDVCLCRHLSLHLKKCHLFSPGFEFVGHDIAEDGNHPAQSKFDLVRNWPQPCIVRDVSQWDFMKQSILSDPCCAQYDHRKRFYLKTDFAQVGMGCVGCQPDNDDVSLAAMHREVTSGPCKFLTNAKDTLRKSSEIVYNFPATEPMRVMHIDCYIAGHLQTYNNVTCYIVGACNMTAFGLLKGITEPNSTTFAAAVMRF